MSYLGKKLDDMNFAGKALNDFEFNNNIINTLSNVLIKNDKKESSTPKDNIRKYIFIRRFYNDDSLKCSFNEFNLVVDCDIETVKKCAKKRIPLWYESENGSMFITPKDSALIDEKNSDKIYEFTYISLCGFYIVDIFTEYEEEM